MGDPALGSNAVFAVDLEQSWGTAKGTPKARKITFVRGGLTPTQALIDNPSLRGDFNAGDPFFGKKSGQGSLSHIPTLKTWAFFMKMLTGTAVKTGTADPWLSTSKLGSTLPLSGIFEEQLAIAGSTRYKKSVGVRINRLSVPISFEGPVQLDLDLMAKDVTESGTAYDASLDDWSADSPLDQMQLAAADVKLFGAACAYVKGGSIDINANLQGDDYRVGGGGTRGSLVPGQYQIGGKLDLVVDSTALLTTLLSGAATVLDLKFTQAANRTAQLVLPRIFLEKTLPVVEGPNGLGVSANFRAVYDPAEQTSVKSVTSLGVDPDTELI